MIETIVIGISGILAAGFGYLLRKIKASEEMTSRITSCFERLIIEKAIHSVEAWAEKIEKKLGKKVEGSEKMKKAIEKVKETRKSLEKWGIKLDISLDEKELEGKIQEIFEELRRKIHQI